ncbi:MULTISPECIES: peptidoglycan editing factor PgeF [Paenibacillus]|uniref:peptidoglycan editing factor PgeF n=1 Tax=Paenibacillus TaxID=44249 RepID=UPI0022B8B745|nr:peptidoglycan editing factor PgeF [Paenibacillus caseinilyticus]MCZ8518786.1 peptidoglycan editing factor PgeF [Paenibacillus caseinilyticus]
MEPFVLQEAGNGTKVMMLSGFMSAGTSVTAGFSTRTGGGSGEPFAGLNCGLHVDDEPERVVANRRCLAEALGVPFEACTYGEQVHGKEIQMVTAAMRGAGIRERETALQAKDGFMTNEPGVYLHALFADCVPLYFYDPIRGAVGLAHAGWKGTALGIARSMVEAMSAAYGTKARDLLTAIGPSIGACCYEVDDTVISRIDKALGFSGGAALEAGQAPFYEGKPNGKYTLNLQAVNRQIMIKAGIMPSHIEISGLCTSCRTDLFFSHRKEEGRTGRMAAWIGLRA